MDAIDKSNSEKFSRSVVITEDGSTTLYVPVLDEHYHSVHGAIQESEHVFIRNGLLALDGMPELNILEIGFGTGLNALLTFKHLENTKQKVFYHGIEKYPLQPAEYEKLNYFSDHSFLQNTLFTMHQSPWNVEVPIHSNFSLLKSQTDLIKAGFENDYHLVYFDAFAPDKQPELWDLPVFMKIAKALKPGGILVTYSAKGQVRRNLQDAGLTVERLTGPPGKREMLRARKPISE